MSSATNLQAAFAKELVAGAERDLDDGTKLRHLSGDIVLDVSEPLKTAVSTRSVANAYHALRSRR